MADGFDGVCIFFNDTCNREARVLTGLRLRHGVCLVLLRCAGFNNFDLDAAVELGISVLRVPFTPRTPSPHAVALLQALNRHMCKANNRVKEGNFSLNGLLGFAHTAQRLEPRPTRLGFPSPP
mmetsp:Transcript_712/g.1598  ORF Transcript_712/g.1598 Transcript_712/m.1598 type:complete len:123 (-) Transcript_712:47-415(-)